LEVIGERRWVLREAGDDGVFANSVDDVGVHLKCWEAFPFPIFPIP